MRSKMLVFVLLMISAASPLVDYSSAQSVMAAVDLECVPQDGGSVNIEVYPGATLTGYTTCTVSNPTIHVEKISITTSADGLAVASPGSVTVAAGGEEEFQVAVRAEARQTMGTRTLSVNAYVQEISGAPPPNNANANSNNIISIIQFAEFNLEMLEPVVEIEVGSDYELEYFLYNTGNGMDTFNLDLDYDQYDDTSFSLSMASVQVDSWWFGQLRVMVSAPNYGGDWDIRADGRHTMEMEIQINVESELGCQKGNCLKTTMNQKIIFYQNQTVQDESESGVMSGSIDDQMLIYGGGGGGILLLLILFVVMRRKK